MELLAIVVLIIILAVTSQGPQPPIYHDHHYQW
jgi:hypothetical protein